VERARGSWGVTLLASPAREVCGPEGEPSWPGLAAQVNDRCGTWGPFLMDTFEVMQTVEVEEKLSMGDIVGECSPCRSTVRPCLVGIIISDCSDCTAKIE
jgi:hypothetical protein